MLERSATEPIMVVGKINRKLYRSETEAELPNGHINDTSETLYQQFGVIMV